MDNWIQIVAQDGGGLGDLAFIIAVLVFSGLGYLAEWFKNKQQEKEADQKWGKEKKPPPARPPGKPDIKVQLPRRPGQQRPTAADRLRPAPPQPPRQARPAQPPQRPGRETYTRQPMAETDEQEGLQRRTPPASSRGEKLRQPQAAGGRSLREELQEAESVRRQAEQEIQARKAEAQKQKERGEQARQKEAQIRKAEAKAEEYRRRETSLREGFAKKKGRGKKAGGPSILAGTKGGDSFQGLSQAELRRAVLLREIFSAPVALRDEPNSWEM
jgi:hypothetical protein